MAKPAKDNRVKRKRGKKFVFHSNDEKEAKELEKKAGESVNPFEDHSKSKRAKKDAEARSGLIQEFKQRGRNSEIVDNRIAEKSSKLNEEDKMKLRFMREQKEQLKREITQTKINRKKTKFNLDNEGSDEGEIDFLTHKGRKIEDMDDFKDKIDDSDDDLYEDKDLQKGRMNEEMVNDLNFGAGDE